VVLGGSGETRPIDTSVLEGVGTTFERRHGTRRFGGRAWIHADDSGDATFAPDGGLPAGGPIAAPGIVMRSHRQM